MRTQNKKVKNRKPQFIVTGKSKSKKKEIFMNWCQIIGTVRFEFEIFEESLYEANTTVLPHLIKDFEKYKDKPKKITYGRMIEHLINQYKKISGLGKEKIDIQKKWTLKELLYAYKNERDKFSHFRMGFSKAMHKEDQAGNDARTNYRNKLYEMHYPLCQIFETLFFVASANLYEPGPKIRRVAHYDIDDLKKNYLPKIYNVFKIPYNRAQRRAINANFKKQIKKWV